MNRNNKSGSRGQEREQQVAGIASHGQGHNIGTLLLLYDIPNQSPDMMT